MNSESLQAASVLCGFCGRMLYGSLSKEDLDTFRDTAGLLREEPFVSVASKPAAELAAILEAPQSEEELDALYHELLQDYTLLFYQTTMSRVSPYESVWRTDDQTLFGPTTLEVRAAYREEGFELATEESVPDDHIGAELNFLSQLFSRAATSEDAAETQRTISAAKAFLSNHLLVFAPYYLEDFIQAAQSSFYQAVGVLTQQIVAALSELFGVQASADIYRMP